MEAGALRHRITVQTKSVTRDTYGAEVITWVTFCESWAEVEPLTGREFLESRQTQAEQVTRIRMRYQAGIVPEMRVIYGSHIYNIDAVIEIDERRREIQLMVTEQL